MEGRVHYGTETEHLEGVRGDRGARCAGSSKPGCTRAPSGLIRRVISWARGLSWACPAEQSAGTESLFSPWFFLLSFWGINLSWKQLACYQKGNGYQTSGHGARHRWHPRVADLSDVCYLEKCLRDRTIARVDVDSFFFFFLFMWSNDKILFWGLTRVRLYSINHASLDGAIVGHYKARALGVTRNMWADDAKKFYVQIVYWHEFVSPVGMLASPITRKPM